MEKSNGCPLPYLSFNASGDPELVYRESILRAPNNNGHETSVEGSKMEKIIFLEFLHSVKSLGVEGLNPKSHAHLLTTF